ncbi:unnamed protein product [Tilletia controversa]|uniref:Uncharacterized protein n=3 Tax=Tilletia TaxID=13289 RepID=A0A8X7MWY8_9BASI|nr:hypothetical protein CF336_g3630 [Tilletia laevis]KAE8202177.1 hypothetical protein CF328_g2365 [Tilletia controversa]KAE8261542.1 hypothetical protein A4X03_0g3166 [Tilletia caries]KAE8202010.1 hypothetical protein CF335_g3578 [Tilletia laevis]KAE8252951.1 hypothetical protein A4X06_0g1803 [Tilletia controversa]
MTAVESSTAAIQSHIQDLLALVQAFLTSDDFASIQNGSPAQSQFIQDIVPLVAALRAEFRVLSDGARESKNAVAAVRAEVDDKLIQLQNLEYEQAKLEEEVLLTRELRSIYQDIDMLSEGEFRQTAPEELRTEAVLEDEHQLMNNRLEHELSERERLEAERKALAREKLGLLKVNRSKAARLKALEKAIRDLLEQATALRDAPTQGE